MRVYVLFHADIEDDRYVRGVFASEEIANAHIGAPEVSAIDHNSRCHSCGGGRHIYWKRHSDTCCAVEEWAVSSELPIDPEPETPWKPDPADERVISGALSEAILDGFRRAGPFQ